jgi:uncharacterized protein YoxC
MNLPSDTPKMPKWMFILGFLIFIGLAWLIENGAAHPFSGEALLYTFACVTIAVVVGVIPFVTEYARQQDEALDNRHRSLQALSVTVAAASEQISIAATGLNGISEAAQDNYSKTERLSKEISDKVAALEAQLAKAKKDEGASAAKLEAYAERLAKIAEQFEAGVAKAARAAESKQAAKAAAAAAAAVAAAHVPEPAPIAASSIAEVLPVVNTSDHPFEKPIAATAPGAEPAAPEVAPETAEATKAETSPTASPADEAPAVALDTPPEVATTPRKRAPRKTAPVAEPAESPAPAAEEPASEPILEPASTEESPAPLVQEIPEPAVSADGATRLVVTAYIGIGNRLFIRGDGPGLSWDKGVPLTFISIGKWRWETNDATSTIRFRLFKNDSVECTALGEASVEPGAQQELSAAF